MAASTWFQMSVCSPVVHGMPPSGSCMRAIDAAVAATSSALRIPSTNGRCWLMPGSRGLSEVEHHAVADDRIQGLLGATGQGAPALRLHDVPDEDLVVRLHERVLVVVDTDRALQPPVRRVEAVGVVLALEDHRVAVGAVVGAAALGDLVDQLVIRV